ncbi:P-loop containing nucleoside triphosphate hydrolase protein, partial [Panaeolus papilionaceus]
MGPTGSGKSSFIEALGLKGASKISSHSLDACTQTVSTYILNNVTRRGDPIYLVDSPGFADTKISEMAITSMLQKWIQDNGYFNYILYLTPITQVRLPGSQRQILKTFNALTGIKSARNVMVVATMWDTIYAEHVAKRAEETYKQLQDDIWEDFIQRGGRISRFHNTEQSVLSILDQVF